MLEVRCGSKRRAQAEAIATVILVVAAVLAGAYLIYTAWSNSRPIHYVPDVVDQKLGQTTDYNYWNLVKDGVIVGVIGAGLSACSAETLGACAATSPAVATVINGALQDTIVTITANFEFDNLGNGTATDLTYGVAVYSDGVLISTSYYGAGNLAAGASVVIPYHYDIKLADLPTAIWNYIQGKGQIDIELVNITYGGRT